MPIIRKTFLSAACLLIWAFVAAPLRAAPGGASAQTLDPALYQATAIVTGTDMRQRPLGFAETLKQVLVKVSADPDLLSNPALSTLADHADQLVASFIYVDPRAWFLHHDDQGTYDRSYELTVHFVPEKIDAALKGLGIAPWRGPRPLLTPVIIVRRDETPFLLSADTPRGTEMRQTIVELASEYGFGVHFPTDNELAEWGVGLVGFPAPLAGHDAGLLRIAGSLDWDVHAMGWVGTWHVATANAGHDWTISGVGFDQAFADMLRGSVSFAHANFPSR